MAKHKTTKPASKARDFTPLKKHEHGLRGAVSSTPTISPPKTSWQTEYKPTTYTKTYTTENPFYKYRYVLLILGIGAIGIIAILATMDFISPTDCGNDAQCFTQLANNCAPAQMTTRISTVSLVLSTKGCTLTKKVESLASEEPEPIRQFLVGKAMQCAYVQGGFDRDYVTTITGNLGTCSGDLRNAIEAILAA